MRDSVVNKLVELLEDGMVSTCTSLKCVIALADDPELTNMDRDDLYEKWSQAKDLFDMQRD